MIIDNAPIITKKNYNDFLKFVLLKNPKLVSDWITLNYNFGVLEKMRK